MRVRPVAFTTAATLAIGVAAVIAVVSVATASALTPTSEQPAPGGTYEALTPSRILDTRSGLGGTQGATTSASVAVLGAGGVPATGVAAVAINLTVTQPSAPGWASAFPTGTPLPSVSNVNFLTGQTVADLAVVSVGDSGRITLHADVRTQFIADVEGYFTTAATAGSSGLFHPLDPARLMDTRSGLGGTAPAGGQAVPLLVTGRDGVPASGVSAVVINTTITAPTAPGYVSAYPAGASRPTASTVNFVRGQTVANRAIVQVGVGGVIDFFSAAGTAQLVVDVTGYFTDASVAQGAFYVPVTPTRVVSDRGSPNTSALCASCRPITVDYAGRDTTSRMESLDPPVAVVLTVTAVPDYSHGSGYLSVLPGPAAKPATSDIDFTGREPIANLSFASLDATGSVSVAASGNTDLLEDLSGYFAAEPADPTPAGMWVSDRQQPVVSTLAPAQVRAIAALSGDGLYFFLKSDGTIWESTAIARLNPTDDPLIQVTGLPVISAMTHSDDDLYALGVNGTVWQAGIGVLPSAPNHWGVTQVAGLPPIASISAGGGLAYATEPDGAVWVWGDNSLGQFGNGTTTSSSTPEPVPALDGLQGITADDYRSFGVAASGALLTWGSSSLPGAVPVTAPTAVAGSCPAQSVHAGAAESVVACRSGSVQMLGNDRGLLATPVTSSTLTDVAAFTGVTSVQALRADGTVWSLVGSDWMPIPWLSGIAIIDGGPSDFFYLAAG